MVGKLGHKFAGHACVRPIIASLPERLMTEVALARSAIANSYFRLWSRAAGLANDAEPDHVEPSSGPSGQSQAEEEADKD